MEIEKILENHNPPSINNYELDYPEFTKIFWKYKGLLKERERNHAFWSSTNDNLKISYEKLDKKEKELAHAYALNKKYLDNIKEGLLLINTDFIIQNQYSKFLIKLLNTDNIAGRNIVDLFYPDKNLQKDERKELEKFLNMVFSNRLAEFEMIMSVNPLNNKILKIIDNEGQEKEIVVDVDFVRIANNHDNIENVMMIFEDKTDIIKMQNEIKFEKGMYQAELESISAIFKAGPEIFKDFIEDLKSVIKEFNKNFDKLNKKRVVTKLFRQIHSLKGTAKYLELNHIAKISHKVENNLSELKNYKVHFQGSIVNEIKIFIRKLMVELSNMAVLNDKVESFSEKIMTSKNAGQEKFLSDFLNTLEEMTHKIARELGKEIVVDIKNSITGLPVIKDLKKPIIHLIRNSIDHGIEDKYQRLIKKKTMEGNIHIHLYERDNMNIIEIFDDGSGINFDKIKEKAIKLGIIEKNRQLPVTKSKLLSILFNSNFSLKDEISDISGRGYGLNIVSTEIKKLNGKIVVSTKKDKGTKFVLKIPK